MARSKVDDVMIFALGQRREAIYSQIKEIEARPMLLDELRAELVEIEAKLKDIDPTIPAIDEAVAPDGKDA